MGVVLSFVKNGRRFDPKQPHRFVLPRRPPWPVVRFMLLAALGAIAAAWAIAYHYAVPMPPLYKPAPPTAAATYAADAGEIPVPEIEPAP